MLSTKYAQREIREWALRKGWRSEEGRTRTFGDDIALCHSELSEALEASRDHDINKPQWSVNFGDLNDFVDKVRDNPDDLRALQIIKKILAPSAADVEYGSPTKVMPSNPESLPTFDEWCHLARMGLAKPEGVPSEMADTVIRLLDIAEEDGYDLGFWVALKMEYNETRAYRHGGRRL